VSESLSSESELSLEEEDFEMQVSNPNQG